MLDSDAAAAEFGRLFQDVYLTFHRRDGRRNELSGASRAVLTHLAAAGPLTSARLPGIWTGRSRC